MENSPKINSKIVKNREMLNKSKSNSQDESETIIAENELQTFNGNSIIMVKPYEGNTNNASSSVPNAFGDHSVEPKSVIAKLYEGSNIRHSSPKTIRLKKHARPRSSADNHNLLKNDEKVRGLCCTLSERSLNPLKFDIAAHYRKELLQHTSSHSLELTSEIKSSLDSNSVANSDDDAQNNSKCNSDDNSDTNSSSHFTKHYLAYKSVDNLVLKSHDPIIHSSPESTKSVPTGKTMHRSTSHDTVICETESTDSLAKQSLLAAQVLHLIPTTMARERNYLQGRVAVNSLLGSAELERVLPGREVRLYVGSWNMNGHSPPNEMNDFILPNAISYVPDILAIGTQESCSERFEWEVILQETIGPTHVLLHAASLGTLHLAIFIRRDLIWFCSLPEDTSMSVRPGSAFRTKGAVAISFSLFGTSYLFVTAHLTAHQEKVKERVQDIKRIIRSLDLPKNLPVRHKSKDVTQNFDCVFWCGDLNFRLGEPRDKVLEWINNTTFPLPPQMPHGYMHSDQLTAVLSDGAAFKGFQEAQIRFPPTYKYDPGTQKFDTSSKQRAPAYTDRILFKSKPQHSTTNYLRRNSGAPINNESPFLECLLYDSVPSILTSDHKPVWALFKNIIRPGIDTVPLAAGLFNREVYLEGVKRRAVTLERSHDASGVCSLQ